MTREFPLLKGIAKEPRLLPAFISGVAEKRTLRTPKKQAGAPFPFCPPARRVPVALQHRELPGVWDESGFGGKPPPGNHQAVQGAVCKQLFSDPNVAGRFVAQQAVSKGSQQGFFAGDAGQSPPCPAAWETPEFPNPLTFVTSHCWAMQSHKTAPLLCSGVFCAGETAPGAQGRRGPPVAKAEVGEGVWGWMSPEVGL